METLFSSLSASIDELKKNPMALLEEANGETVVILHNNRPLAYLVPADVYEDMLELLEDYELGQIVQERLAKEKNDAIEVNIHK